MNEGDMLMKRNYLYSCQKASVRGFRTGDWSVAEAINRHNEEVLRSFFDKLVSGEINVFYSRYKSTGRSKDVWENCTAWHRSTRPGILVQESHMWFRNGECIPCSHQDINSFDDLMNCHGYTLGTYLKTA